MDTLKQLMEYANRQVAIEKDLKELEERSNTLKKEHRILSEETIPGILHELGMASFTLTTGEVVTVKEEVQAKIPDRFLAEAYKWLRDNGHDSIIKTQVVSRFSAGEEAEATALAEKLSEQGLAVTMKSDIHAGTLKRFVREQLEEGNAIPQQLFGAYVKEKSMIK